MRIKIIQCNAIDPQRWKLITDDELGALACGEKNLTGFRGKAVDYFALGSS